MSDFDDLDAKMARTQRAMAESKQALAHARGKLEATLEAWAREPAHAELLRCLAWEQSGHRFRTNAGKVADAPDGWPLGIDGEQFVGGWVKEQMATYADPQARVDREADAIPAIKDFRKRLAAVRRP